MVNEDILTAASFVIRLIKDGLDKQAIVTMLQKGWFVSERYAIQLVEELMESVQKDE